MAEVFCPSPEEVKDKQKPIDSKETIDALKAEILKESQRERKVLILEMYLTKLVCSGKDSSPIIKNILASQNKDIFMGVIKNHEGKKDYNNLRLLFTKPGENGGFKINFYSDEDIYQALSASDLFGDFKNIQKNGQIYKNDGKSFGSVLLKDGDNIEAFDDARHIVKSGENIFKIVLNVTKNQELANICKKVTIQPGDVVIFGENQVSIKSKKDGKINTFGLGLKPKKEEKIPTLLPIQKPNLTNEASDGKIDKIESAMPGRKPEQEKENPQKIQEPSKSNEKDQKGKEINIKSWEDLSDPKQKEKAFKIALNKLIGEIGDESIKKVIKDNATSLFNSNSETLESLKSNINSLTDDLKKVPAEVRKSIFDNFSGVIEYMKSVKLSFNTFLNELKNIPSDIKDLFIKNFSGVIKYMKSFKLNFETSKKDFNGALDFINKNLSTGKFDSLKANILNGSIGPLMYVLHEFPRQKFETISPEHIVSLIYFESEFKNSTESDTGSVGLLQTTSYVVKDMKSHPENYNTDIIKELVERNSVASIDKLSKNHRRQYENSIDLGLMYLKMLEGNGKSYPSEASTISKDSDHFYKQVSKALGKKNVPITRQEYDSVVSKLNGKDKQYLEVYSAYRDYNGQKNQYPGEKHHHRIYYALSTLCMAEVMKKGAK